MGKKSKLKEGAPEGAVDTAAPITKPDKYDYVIRNKKARALTKHRKAVIIAGIILLLVLLLVGVFYGFYSAVDANNFRIFIDRSGSRILSLSMNPTMEPSSELIEIVGPNEMTNTSLNPNNNKVGHRAIEECILDIIGTDGSFTSVDDYFIAGTFYIKNLTAEDKEYTEILQFEECSKGTSQAMRVMVIRNDEIKVYAHPQTENGIVIYDEEGNAVPEEVVPGSGLRAYYEKKLDYDEEGNYVIKEVEDKSETWKCKNFYCDEDGSYEKYAVYEPNNFIKAGDVIRYSIIIWFEGNDAQCVDAIIDGVVKMNLSFAC